MTRPANPLKYIPSLAASHLRHEWILTFCLVIALAAVIAPLLVLLGLKYGTIQTLRERLVEDPVFREIRPSQTREFSPQWFEELSVWPGVGFYTPTILPLSSVISVVHGGSNSAELIDLIPTAAGDPLLLENGGVVPADGEVVLSAEAARRCGVQSGEDIISRVTRSRGGRMDFVEERLRVVSVLSPRAGSLARVYAPLPFVLDVEGYKEGYAAPSRGWAGETPQPYPSFDGAILLLPHPMLPIARSGLVINTGFGRITDVSAERVKELLGFSPPHGFGAYDLLAPGTPVTMTNLRAIDQKLRGQTRVLLPYVRGVTIESGGKSLSPIGLSLTSEQAQLLGVPETPWGGYTGNSPEDGRLVHTLWPEGETSADEMHVRASGIAELQFDLRVIGTTSFGRPVVPIELMGILRTASQRAISFNQKTQRFEMARGGYRGFRLYAESIDDVPQLYYKLKAEGIEVIAEVEAIERIRVLDQGLTRLFWLIALLGLFGGTAVLVSSLYAAVERRRRDLGVLRLLGFSRLHVFFFPIAQGLMVAILGLLAGFGGYAALAWVINHAFATELAPGEAFCVIPSQYIPVFCFVTLVLAGLASLVAGWRATCIDPAEAIREQ
ncbi:ABC transporter permease [Desulfopila aestuarii]|uniref:Putative ABC transport system permease protein n=1 Tax=Desulfopila aestuarii DSM 18488 TaxID=1121416 RepID=A0A1M7YFK3_9BACT|nr:FtsX-like permease family protein [Desulfopila aestuarii]SHO51349.1 putative ABC transport system permease protein [Desulfopila aestuarii DSM 18488]